MAADLCFPILKYSHTTGAPSARADTLSWDHTASDYMFVNVIGKDTTLRNGLLEMAVIRGTTTLESIDLAAHIDMTTRRDSHTRMPFGSNKDRVMQITLPINEQQTRRVQLRFLNVEHCQKVVGIIKERGLEFREPHTSKNGQRPDTARSEFRPLTAQPAQLNSPYFAEDKPARSSTIRVPDMEAGSLSQRPAARLQPSDYPSKSSAFSITPPKIIARDERLAPREAFPSRPSTSQMWRSTTVPSQPVALSSGDYHMNVGERPSSTSHAANVQAIYQSAAEDISMDVALNMRPPSAVSRSSTALVPDIEPGNINAQWSSSNFKADHRPNTALSSSSSRPGSSRALMMAPLPKPKIVQNRAGTPSYKKAASVTKDSSPSRPASAMPLTTVSELTKPTRPGFPVAPSREEHDHTVGQHKTHHASPSTSNHGFDEPLPMSELLARRKAKPLSKKSSNVVVQRTDSLADTPYENEPSTRAANGIATQGSMRESAMERACDANMPNRRLQEERLLEEYSARSPEDRLAIMDQFVIDNLENPSFTTLCEDVEKCWRRFSLGL